MKIRTLIIAAALILVGAAPLSASAGDGVVAQYPTLRTGKRTAIGITLEPNGEGTALNCITLVKKGKRWIPAGNEYIYIAEDSLNNWIFAPDTLVPVDIAGHNYIRWQMLVREGGELTWNECLFGVDTTVREMLSFYGKCLTDQALLPEEFKIEGIFDLYADDEEPDPLHDYLRSIMDADSRLQPLPESTYLTDKSIEWWTGANPGFMNSPAKINMALIPAECSLVQAYDNGKPQKSSKFGAFVTEIRGFTVVIAKDLKTGNYFLAWAEPECKNRKTSRYLANYYFENDSTLSMLYTVGKKTFKLHLNLSSHSLRKS